MNNTKSFGTTVSGSTYVWAKNFGDVLSLTTRLYNKKQDGNFESMFIKVRLVGEGSKATFEDGKYLFKDIKGFLSCNIWTDKRHNTHEDVVLVIQDFAGIEPADDKKPAKKYGSK